LGGGEAVSPGPSVEPAFGLIVVRAAAAAVGGEHELCGRCAVVVGV